MRIILFSTISLLMISCGTDVPQSKEDVLPADTLNFTKTIFKEQTGNCDNACCVIYLEYPFFSGSFPADSLNRMISSFFCRAIGQGNSTVIAEAWDRTSRTFMEQAEKYPEHTVSWNYEGSGEIKYQDPEIISILLSMYSFEGGAHPNTQVEMFSFDIKSRHKLLLEDIFTDEKEITRLAEEQFRMDKNIPDGQSLQDAGYDFEEFYLTQNFLITGKEILFYYNTYEIAPYVFGPTELVIDLGKISHLLKPEHKPV